MQEVTGLLIVSDTTLQYPHNGIYNLYLYLYHLWIQVMGRGGCQDHGWLM